MASRPLVTVSRLVAVVLLAVVAPHIYGRLRMLGMTIYNHPSKLEEVRSFQSHEILFRDQLQNCEDGLVVEEDGKAILSCDPGRNMWNTVMGVFTRDLPAIPSGRLVLVHYDKEPLEIQDIEFQGYPFGKDFHPLGIEYHRASSTLFVCNHKTSGPSLEVFQADFSSTVPVAKHVKTISHPLIRSPNGIAAINANEVLLTSDHHFLVRWNPWLARMESFAGISGGAVLHVDISRGEVKLLARMPFPNGITIVNGSTVAVASSSRGNIWLFELQSDHTLKFSKSFNVPFLPDNLSTDKNNVVLISGHPHAWSLEHVAKGRLDCQSDDLRIHCSKSTAPSWVAEWSPTAGLKTIYRAAEEFGSSAGAARDTQRGIGIVTGLYEKGILVWRESRST